jgi:peroxiredoxin
VEALQSFQIPQIFKIFAHLMPQSRSLGIDFNGRSAVFKTIFASILLFIANLSFAASEFPASPEKIQPILLGSKLPDVALTTLQGKATTLKQQVAGKPSILVFYRGGWCPYCNLQLSDLRLIKKQAETLGYQIIAISPDRSEELKRTMGKQKLDYTLLSDNKAAALRAFGIGFQVDAATLEKYKGYGIDLEKASGQKHHALPVPSVFIIDKEGILQFSYVNPDYSARVPGSVVLEAAKVIAERKQYLKPKA